MDDLKIGSVVTYDDGSGPQLALVEKVWNEHEVDVVYWPRTEPTARQEHVPEGTGGVTFQRV